MKDKLEIKNSLFQIGVGLVAYFLFIRKKEPKKTLLVGDLLGEGTPYVSQYFKDSEYFGNYLIPELYHRNWLAMSKMLDKIRGRFGSAIVITKGYMPPLNGLITDLFQTCLAVEIYAQNNDNDRMHSVIVAMQNSGEIIPANIERKVSGAIKITLYA